MQDLKYEATIGSDSQKVDWVDVTDLIDCPFNDWIARSTYKYGRIKLVNTTESIITISCKG